MKCTYSQWKKTCKTTINHRHRKWQSHESNSYSESDKNSPFAALFHNMLRPEWPKQATTNAKNEPLLYSDITLYGCAWRGCQNPAFLTCFKYIQAFQFYIDTMYIWVWDLWINIEYVMSIATKKLVEFKFSRFCWIWVAHSCFPFSLLQYWGYWPDGHG